MFEAIVRNKLIYDLSLNLQMNELSFVIIGLTVDDNDNVIYGPERSIRINSQASFGVNTFLSTYFDENYGLITFRDNRSVDRIVSALIVVDLIFFSQFLLIRQIPFPLKVTSHSFQQAYVHNLLS